MDTILCGGVMKVHFANKKNQDLISGAKGYIAVADFIFF